MGVIMKKCLVPRKSRHATRAALIVRAVCARRVMSRIAGTVRLRAARPVTLSDRITRRGCVGTVIGPRPASLGDPIYERSSASRWKSSIAARRNRTGSARYAGVRQGQLDETLARPVFQLTTITSRGRFAAFSVTAVIVESTQATLPRCSTPSQPI
jgi:hypothetical protein